MYIVQKLVQVLRIVYFLHDQSGRYFSSNSTMVCSCFHHSYKPCLDWIHIHSWHIAEEEGFDRSAPVEMVAHCLRYMDPSGLNLMAQYLIERFNGKNNKMFAYNNISPLGLCTNRSLNEWNLAMRIVTPVVKKDRVRHILPVRKLGWNLKIVELAVKSSFKKLYMSTEQANWLIAITAIWGIAIWGDFWAVELFNLS